MNCALLPGLVKGLIERCHIPDGVLFHIESLNDLVAGKRLFNRSVHFSQGFLVFRVIALRFPGNPGGRRHADGHCCQGDQGEPRADRQHQGEGADNAYRRTEKLQQTVLQSTGDLVQVIGCPAEDISLFMLIIVAEGKPG